MKYLNINLMSLALLIPAFINAQNISIPQESTIKSVMGNGQKSVIKNGLYANYKLVVPEQAKMKNAARGELKPISTNYLPQKHPIVVREQSHIKSIIGS